MFNLFKKKAPYRQVQDLVWMNETAKFNALLEEWNKNKQGVIIFWFQESQHRFDTYTAKISNETVTTELAATLIPIAWRDKPIIFAEHFPLSEKENTLYDKLHLQTIHVWSALDDPLFKQFGGETFVKLMQRLGMKEDEAIEHSMVQRSISNAQQKIAKKVLIEQAATSSAEWFEKNMNS